MFAHFSLPDIPAVSRRTVTAALIIGVAALVGCISFGKPMIGVGACIGLALGTLNFRLVGASVIKVGKREEENKRRPLALNTVGRLGVISVITIGLLLLSFQLGFGVLSGLAVFQLVLLANVARSMMKFGPQGDGLDVSRLDGADGPDDRRGEA
ncbi:MAG TPA: ATP synthase subunit I [Acidimicrobiales bacterium]|nr:ATP synthase subunit I [Acidimicrobiales bacterium]